MIRSLNDTFFKGDFQINRHVMQRNLFDVMVGYSGDAELDFATLCHFT